ncbi:MAG: 50S ribosomal protein L11 methyltransferase [Lachnospiraceae bacterium]|nr:50S ribosomal protein L11 methyltransferase [Lachnospiraceae bacterium]
MKYDKFTIETTTEAEDIIISMLDDLGVEGAQIEDKIPLTEEELAGMFVDIIEPVGEDDGRAYISFYLPWGEDHGSLISEIKAELSDMKSYVDNGSCVITSSETEDEDYLNNWKQYFHQFYIDDILFIPSWEENENKDHRGLTIHIDPGTAFGTGKHETTELCIRALRKHVSPGCSVLDLGTGSGILAILSYKFGAGRVVGTDIDICAKAATADNMAANGLADAGFKLLIGNIISDENIQKEVGDGYDIVAANIIAQVLIPIMPHAVRALKPGGICIMSGIIDEKEDDIVRACSENGLEIIETKHLGEWVGVTAKKKP